MVMNDINRHLVGVSEKSARKKYISSREKELRKEFTEPLTNLSVYQGKVLMKLINRETGNNCYEIIKESPTRYKLIEYTEEHYKVAKALQKQKLFVPHHAQSRLKDALAGCKG